MEKLKLKEELKVKKSILDEITYNKNPNYDNGMSFMNWQICGEFKYKDEYLRFSDTPSGCGPIQMYHYTAYGEDFKVLLNTLIYEEMLKTKDKKWFNRTPTAITFIHGDPSEEFDELMQSIGFEILKTYTNIAHGHSSDDTQSFYYLDITKLI